TPINDQNRALIAALEQELAARGPRLPVYWGNRNWHPLLPDTIRRTEADGMKRALASVPPAVSSFSGVRQYRENILQALGSSSLQIDKLRVFYNHPGFIEAMVENCREALNACPEADLIFTGHSIPLSYANTSRYAGQLQEACRLVGGRLGRPD